MEKLGEYKTGKSCFYIKRIEDINTDVARDLIQRSVEHLTKIDRDYLFKRTRVSIDYLSNMAIT